MAYDEKGLGKQGIAIGQNLVSGILGAFLSPTVGTQIGTALGDGARLGLDLAYPEGAGATVVPGAKRVEKASNEEMALATNPFTAR